uniref:Uncharacterized protein n=1 Tax=Aegilops tauschii subsp. strangulata TaxID=200361 RepID=A0A453CME9_AEGTS
MPCLGEGKVWRQEGRCPSKQGGEQEGEHQLQEGQD